MPHIWSTVFRERIQTGIEHKRGLCLRVLSDTRPCHMNLLVVTVHIQNNAVREERRPKNTKIAKTSCYTSGYTRELEQPTMSAALMKKKRIVERYA